MTTHPVYDKLIADITDEIERKVFQVLADRAGTKVSRPELILAVFGTYARQEELGNSTEDRQIRKCVEALQRREYPILASSGEAGYILVDDEEQLRQYVAELQSRIDNLKTKTAAILRSGRRIQDIRAYRAAEPAAVQPHLFA